MIQEEPKKGRVYDTQAWRNLCTMARQALPPYCARCGGYIDLSLPANHQMSWTLGHRIEQDLLPDEIKYNPTMEDVQPEHRICGSRAGAQYRNMKAAKNRGVVEQTPHSAALDAYYAVHEIEQLEESARFLEESRHSVLGGSPDSLPEYEQVTPARYESPKHPRAVGSYGQEVIDFAKDVMGVDLYPWQQKVINRMYEHDENGDLTWS